MWWWIGLGLTLALYLLWIRPWQLRWGTTGDEASRPMPGDGLVPRPHFIATRAVTVHAPPEAIYPWIRQIGFGRAGWYSYDWLDNFGRPSAEEILPQFQERKVGDLVPVYDKIGFHVEAMEPPHWILWVGEGRYTTWLWICIPQPDSTTRLITRVRSHYRWLHPTILFSMLIEFTDIIMMRKCLLGIKRRAEKLAAQQTGETA